MNADIAPSRNVKAKTVATSVVPSRCLLMLAGIAGVLIGSGALSAHAETLRRPQTAISGWGWVAESNPEFVVFGEIHGTKNAPAFFGSVASSLATQGESILVAVELNSVEDENLQIIWKGSHDGFRKAVLNSGILNRNDGVASVAMLDMLCRLHALKSKGMQISVVAFNGFRDEAQRFRLEKLGIVGAASQQADEMAQAENISNAARRGKFDRILVLVGNVHARKDRVEHNGDNFEPMALFLEKEAKVVSLNMAYSGGTAWNCSLRKNADMLTRQQITPDMMDCGIHAMDGGAARLNGKPFLGKGILPGVMEESGYDGFFWLGRVSGSRPAS